MVIIPPFTALAQASELISEAYSLKLGAQNMNAHKSGRSPGRSARRCCGNSSCATCVLGHSERRQLFGETDAVINAKFHAAHEATLKPIFCIGETLAERDGGQVEAVLARAVARGSGRSGRQAYAGNGDRLRARLGHRHRAATPRPSRRRKRTRSSARRSAQITDAHVAERVRIQYGGSVKTSNAAELLAQPDIDGALVGGASLDPRDFAEIVKAAKTAKS